MVKVDIISYYDEMADCLIKFLEPRNVFLRIKQGNRLIPRFYERNRPIRIREKSGLMYWAKQNIADLYGSIARVDGKVDFVIDVDQHNLPLDLAKIAAVQLYEVLEGYQILPAIKFSGEAGFHFMCHITNVPKGEKVYLYCRKILNFLRDKLEHRLQRSEYRNLFYQFVPMSLPITSTMAKEKAVNQLVLDKVILRKNGYIRAAYSIHEETELISVPLTFEELKNFTMNLASPKRVIKVSKQQGYQFEIPEIEAILLKKELAQHERKGTLLEFIK